MKAFKGGIFLPLLLLAALNLSASESGLFRKHLAANRTDSILNSSGEIKKSTLRFCTCQLLEVQSKNERIQNLVILAEKTSFGNQRNEQQLMLRALQKERKNMQYFFYSRMKIKKEIFVRTDCHSLYLQLKTIYDDLRLYDVIDADIRSRI